MVTPDRLIEELRIADAVREELASHGLGYLYAAPGIKTLAVRIGVTAPTVSRYLAELEREGVVVREVASTNRTPAVWRVTE